MSTSIENQKSRTFQPYYPNEPFMYEDIIEQYDEDFEDWLFVKSLWEEEEIEIDNT